MEAFLEHDSLRATAQHIGLLDAKIEKLSRARSDSWAQLLTAAARLYAAGETDEFDLVALYDSMKTSYGAGFSVVWDQHLPVEAGRMQFIRMSAPNGPMGSWAGEVPLGPRDPAPPTGIAVVYVLFDAANDPIYVGSTGKFRQRLSSHRKEKSGIRRWAAYRCRSREHAYELEDQLLKQHKPRMNRKASR